MPQAHVILAGQVILGRVSDATPFAPPALTGPGGILPQGVVIQGGRIVRVLAEGDPLPVGAEVWDFRPHLLGPGSIDVHVHGGAGFGFAAEADDVAAVCRYRASTGATGLLPTITGTWDELLPALGRLAGWAGRDTGGASVLGVHVEGPFINPKRKGAINPATMRPPNLDDLHRLQDAAGGWIRMMTIAPELPEALAVVEEMVRLGICPSVGHTDATYEQVLASADAGARKSTHTFNAMRPMAHRDPGAVAAILVDDRLVAELIADGVHVHLGAMRVLLKAKGPGRTALVTDGVPFAGLDVGTFDRPGRRKLVVRNGAALLEDGTIAGSISPLNRNMALLRERANVAIEDLFEMVASVPAGLIDRPDLGMIAAGARADLAIYDQDFNCLATIVGGRLVHRADPAASPSSPAALAGA